MLILLMKLDQIIAVLLLVVAFIVLWSITKALLPFLWSVALVLAVLAAIAFLLERGEGNRS